MAKHSNVKKAPKDKAEAIDLLSVDDEVEYTDEDIMTEDTDDMPDLMDDSEDNEDGEEDEEDEEDDAEEDDILSELLVTEDGETIPEVLVGVRGALDQIAVGLNKQNKILFMIAKALSDMSE